MRRTFLRTLFLLAVSLAFILSFSPSFVRADSSLLVFPPSGLPGTTFQISAGGFSANEGVQLWTQYPTGRILQLSTVNADSKGNATFQVSTDSSYPLGSYILLAHGKSSNTNIFGKLSVGSGSGGGAPVTGTAYCTGQNFSVPGFVPGEQVGFTAQLPGGSIQPLIAVTADGSGTATFTVPLQPGLPVGTYVIMAQGLGSGRQTSDTLNFDGRTLAGSNCSMSLSTGIPSGYVPGPIPKNIVQFRGAGVYLNTDPNQLYYFGCDWKWRPMGGIIYFIVLGFKPYEQVQVSYQIMIAQPNPQYYTTLTADAYGNVVFAVNAYTMQHGHYHWWFTSPSATYCGHYDA